MPASTFPDYAQQINAIVSQLVADNQAFLLNLQIDQRSTLRGRIEGRLQFMDGSELHFREFVDLTRDEPKVAYAYHYQNADTRMIFRYDNAAHRPAIGILDHKHMISSIEANTPPTLLQVVDEILRRTTC